jgi:hypothetical protein
MADPGSEAELWGLTPNTPPPPATGQGPPAQVPVQTPPPPLVQSEAQRWGTEAMPGQTRPAPYALDTGAPPIPQQGPITQAHVDDAREWDINKQEEIDAFTKNKLSVLDYKQLPDAFTAQQHPEWGKLQTSKEMLSQVTNPKEAKGLEPLVRRLETRIQHDVEQRNKQLTTTRREQLARDDAPYQSVEARDKTAAAMTQHVGTTINDVIANVGSNDPKTARQADYDLTVSPIMTMSRPKPGADTKAKPDATNRDYTPLRDAATNLAIHNRSLPDGASAVRYAIKIATPGGGTDDNGKPVAGYNGRLGMGAANYKVIGRDDLDNVLVQMDDGKRLRVSGDTYRNLLTARQQGAQRARQWEADYKKSQEPGLVRRAMNWGLSVIPEKGF